MTPWDFYLAGGRISEVLALRWSHVYATDKGGEMEIFHGKGNKERVIRLPADLFAALQEMRADRRASVQRWAFAFKTPYIRFRGLHRAGSRTRREGGKARRSGLSLTTISQNLQTAARGLLHSCVSLFLTMERDDGDDRPPATSGDRV